jgi:hypothetical protein
MNEGCWNSSAPFKLISENAFQLWFDNFFYAFADGRHSRF